MENCTGTLLTQPLIPLLLTAVSSTESVKMQFLSIPLAHRQITNWLYIYQNPKLWMSHHEVFCTIILQIIWSSLKIKNKSTQVLLGSEQERNQLLLSHLLKLSLMPSHYQYFRNSLLLDMLHTMSKPLLGPLQWGN